MFIVRVQEENPSLAGKVSRTTMSSSDSPSNPALIQELESIGIRASFNPGECILTEGEAGKGIFVLHDGSAQVTMVSHNGETIGLRTLQPGSFIGLSSTLSCDHCCYSVHAAESCSFTFIPAGQAQEFLRSRPDLCLQVIQLLGQEMSSLCNERALLNARMQPVQIRA